MGKDLLDRLKDEVLIIDSAMGTMLQEAGLNSGHEAGELWNVDPLNSEKVLSVHRANVEAGSDIVTTNTFGANRIKLAHYEAEDRVAEINLAAASLARKAAGRRALVAGDIGPTGEILEQWGGSRPAVEMLDAFRQQASALSEGGVDLFALETFMDFEELKLAIKAVKSVSSLPVIASMSFQAGPGGLRTMWGLTPEDAAAQLDRAGAEIIGTNCGLTVTEMVEVVRGLIRGAGGRPVAAQPNAGSPSVVAGRTVYLQSACRMAEETTMLADAGARLVGGCCGSTPEFIAGIKKRLSGA